MRKLNSAQGNLKVARGRFKEIKVKIKHFCLECNKPCSVVNLSRSFQELLFCNSWF
jgi:hypothetical protein